MKQVTKKQYVFTFVGGGWNSVYAKTLRGAIREIKQQWPNKPGLVPDLKSVHLTNQEEYDFLMRSFW